MRRYLQSLVALIGLTAGALMLVLTFVFGLMKFSRYAAWWSSRMWAWLILHTGGVQPLRGHGFEKLTKLRGAVVMSNHESLLDPVVVIALSKRPVHFLARHELFYIPIFGWAMWSNGHLAVRRGKYDGSVSWLCKAVRAVRNDKLILVYPEGTRSTGGDLLPFKKGGFLLALRSGVPIVPIGVSDTMLVCPKGWHWAGRAPVAAVVGEPIDTQGYSVCDLNKLMQTVRERIVQLRSEAASMNLLPAPKS